MRTEWRPIVEAIQLDEKTRHGLTRRYPQVVDRHDVILISADEAVRADVSRIVGELVDQLNERLDSHREHLVEELLEPLDVETPNLAEMAKREAVVRRRILADVGALGAQEVAERAGSAAGGRSKLAYQWRKRGLIFSVNYRNLALFPAFQFDEEGHPVQSIRIVLNHLGWWPDWAIAKWFVTSNPLLDLDRPLDRLAAMPAAVVDAAERDGRRRGPESNP